MALKAMSMFSGKLFSDVMKIMFANSFEVFYNGLRQTSFSWRFCLDFQLLGELSMYQTNECFGDIAQENAQKVNGYIVYNFHTGEIDYEVERKYWDRSDQRTFKDLAASNINCYFIPLHIFQNAEKANAGFVARFAILEE